MSVHQLSNRGFHSRVAALNISDSVERGFDVFFAWIPALIGAVVILVIGFFIAKLVHEAGGLTQAGLDRNLLSGRSGEWVSKVAASRRD